MINSQTVFNFVAGAAAERRTVTYSEIVKELEGENHNTVNQNRVLNPILQNIFLLCYLHDLPQLTAVVVRKTGKQAGTPGDGFFKLLDAVSDDPMHKCLASEAGGYRKRVVVRSLQEAVFEFGVSGGFQGVSNSIAMMDQLTIADEEENYLEHLIDDKLSKQVKPKRYGPDQETSPLSYEQTNAILEEMRKKIAKEFGVTLQDDPNGAWGQAGRRYLTLRFGGSEVSLTINQVVSNAADEAHNAFLNEDK